MKDQYVNLEGVDPGRAAHLKIGLTAGLPYHHPPADGKSGI